MTAELPAPVVLADRFFEAVAFACTSHAGQVRKGTQVPYASHLLAVASLVLEAGGDEDLAIAALLHDVLEDQGGAAGIDRVRARFGQRVLGVVLGCSDSLAPDARHKAPWRERKSAYLEHLERADLDTVIVSLADKVHNARSIVVDLRIIGTAATWAKFHASREQTLWYLDSVLAIGERRDAPRMLTDQLRQAIGDIRQLDPGSQLSP